MPSSGTAGQVGQAEEQVEKASPAITGQGSNPSSKVGSKVGSATGPTTGPNPAIAETIESPAHGADNGQSTGTQTGTQVDSHADGAGHAPAKDAVRTYKSTATTADAETLARAQSGDHVAFAQLYSLHKRRVYSLCLRMLGNVAEAEDLTQESFLQLHRKIATFRGDSAFSTWLHRLTINVVLMHLRRKGLNLISLDEALDPSPEYGPARSFGAPDLRLSGSIDRMTLERAVENLPAGYRLIFVLHDIEGYEHNEIAALLDCSIGNSKSQLHKARMKLREALRAPADEEVAK